MMDSSTHLAPQLYKPTPPRPIFAGLVRRFHAGSNVGRPGGRAPRRGTRSTPRRPCVAATARGRERRARVHARRCMCCCDGAAADSTARTWRSGRAGECRRQETPPPHWIQVRTPRGGRWWRARTAGGPTPHPTLPRHLGVCAMDAVFASHHGCCLRQPQPPP
jgi:hypothetical protein